MTKTQFSQALALYVQTLLNGTQMARIAAQSAVLGEHARLVDGLGSILENHRNSDSPITYRALRDLLVAPQPTTKTGLPIRFHDAPDPVHSVTILGEESGFTDGLPQPEFTDSPLRWYPGDSKPMTPGVYPTKTVRPGKSGPTEKFGYSHWDGENWGVQRYEVSHVRVFELAASAIQNKMWQNRKQT